MEEITKFPKLAVRKLKDFRASAGSMKMNEFYDEFHKDSGLILIQLNMIKIIFHRDSIYYFKRDLFCLINNIIYIGLPLNGPIYSILSQLVRKYLL